MARRLPNPTTKPSTSNSDALDEILPPIGDNNPPRFAVPVPPDITSTLKADFARQLDDIAAQANLCKSLTKDIGNDEELTTASDAFADLRKKRKAWESHREGEKVPFLAAERAVDGYFVPVRDRIDTILRELEAKCGAYLERKQAQERERRRQEAERLRQEEQRRQAEARELQRQQEELERKSREARTAQQRERAAIQAESKAAEVAEVRAGANTLGNMALRADEAAGGKAADLARTRGEASLSTLAERWTFTVEDFELVPLDQLRPYLKRDAIEAALRAFVKVHRDTKPIAGVSIFPERKANIR